MEYKMTNPCDDCPFLAKFKHGYSMDRLEGFAAGQFPCHKTAGYNEEEGHYEPKADSQHCAGALIFNEKREQPHQMMRICERLGFYDRTKLNMDAPVR